MVAVGVLALWLCGMAALARRELFRGQAGRLERAALFVSPGAEFYEISDGSRQIGFGSSTIDTSATTIRISDQVVTDLVTGGAPRRLVARSVAELTRTLRLTRFAFEVGGDAGPYLAAGRLSGDTLLTVVVRSGGAPADTQRIRLTTPLLLPTMVPMAIALGDAPAVGSSHTYEVFDPFTDSTRAVTVHVRAESLFVLVDSAAPDAGGERWVAAHRDTVRAWRVEQDGGGMISGWIDGRGRMVEATPLGMLHMKRTAYELAFENWSRASRGSGPVVSPEPGIQERTAIAAAAPIGALRQLRELRVRLRGPGLEGYDLAGGRQSLSGDTLTVRREDAGAMVAGYALPADPARFGDALAPEPTVQSHAPEIVALAARIAGRARDPRVVAERITTWVHDSIENRATPALPGALRVLRARRGDCGEHTELYLALARAAGLPARRAAGLAYVRGTFYFHAWPEVWLGRWVAVDPTFGQFPADAAHLRLTAGGDTRRAELPRRIGTLRVDVLSSN